MGAHRTNPIAIAAAEGDYDYARTLKVAQIITTEEALQEIVRTVPFEDREALEASLREMTGLAAPTQNDPDFQR